MDLPLDESALREKQLAVTGVDRATEFVRGQAAEDAKQKMNRDGQPLWDVFCTEQVGRQVTNFKVRMASLDRPAIEGIGRIYFGGLRASTYADGNRNMVSFSADTFTLGEPPSASRPAPSEPSGGRPPAPAEAGKKAA